MKHISYSSQNSEMINLTLRRKTGELSRRMCLIFRAIQLNSCEIRLRTVELFILFRILRFPILGISSCAYVIRDFWRIHSTGIIYGTVSAPKLPSVDSTQIFDGF